MTRNPQSSSWPSRSNHSQLVNDPHIQSFLRNCRFPKRATDEDGNTNELVASIDVSDDAWNRNILTVDGSYVTISANKDYPSSEIAFFQFGAILFSFEDLKNLSGLPFIFPENMRSLQNLERIKLAIPIKNILSNNQTSLNESIRSALHEFFLRAHRNDAIFMETLCWLIFEEYSDAPKDDYVLSSNPNLHAPEGPVRLVKSEMNKNYIFESDSGPIYLTDVFRFHEVIDEDYGASGILGYMCRLIEQIILLHYLRIIYINQPNAVQDFVFISNGPLSFSGQTANMHKVVRNLCNFLARKTDFYLFGIEKSGPFVEHAFQICTKSESRFFLDKNQYLILSNDYIYRYIVPGDPSRMHYGATSYYGGKVIVHTNDEQIFVITIPIAHPDMMKAPKLEDYRNLSEVIRVMQSLKCDMYDDAIVPVAMANKLISLASYPSQAILEKFVKSHV